MIKFILLITLVLLCLEAKAQEAGENTVVSHKEYFQCRSFSECTAVWNGCSDIAVNKLYSNRIAQTSVCTAAVAHDPKAMPTCQEGQCVMAVAGGAAK